MNCQTASNIALFVKGFKNRDIVNSYNILTIREQDLPYSTLFYSKKDPLRPEKSHFLGK